MDLAELNGAWALITGASTGIGREFAQQLAQHGLNVAIVARRGDLLASQAIDLHSRHGIQAQPISIDLAEKDAVGRLWQALSARDIKPRLLVNNAAIGRWGRFVETDPETCIRMAIVNAVAPLELCRAFLPELAARTPSAIINVSSPAAFQPVPYMAEYAASKAFLHSLSLALHEEWRERGVYVQTLVPGPTATEFDARAGAYQSQLSTKRDPPQKPVETALRAFAQERPLVISASGTLGQRLFSTLAPTRLVLHKVGQMFRPPVSQTAPPAAVGGEDDR